MSLPNYLAAIKSAGIYRFVWDKSEVAGADAEVLRLVVGYSEKGPFNTPVYVKTTAEFKTIYGDINKKLERRGIFFHRMALQALAAGPILCLNLKKFSQEQVDWVGGDPTKAFVEKHYEETTEGGKVTAVTGGAAVEKVFNTSRFWNIDPDVLPSQLENNDYITIAATDSVQSSNTIFMRGYKPTGYDVTILTWYKQQGEDVPSYFEGYEDMMISDFWAEIYVFKGEFTKSIAASEELKRYFNVVDGKVTLKPYVVDAFGVKQDTLSVLSSDENSGFVNVYRGCLIPYFKGSNGSYQSLDLLFNADNSTHKMVMKLNADLLYNDEKTPLDITTRGWDSITAKVLEDALKVAKGEKVTSQGIDCLSNKDIIPFAAIADYDEGWTYNRSEELVGDPDLYVYKVEGNLEKGVIELDANYADCGFAEGDRFLLVNKTTDTEPKDVQKVVTLAKYNVARDADGNAESVSLTFADDAASLMSITTTTVTKNDQEEDVTESSTAFYLIKCNNIITEEIATIAPIYVKGYHFLNTKPASGKMMDKLNWQKSILNALIDYDGLREALTNRKDSEWRYLVDTFESYVDESLKSTLAYIVKLKDNALGILNFPAISTFTSCDYTSFTDAKGKFAMKYVKQGANKLKPSAKLFSLPMESEGASFVGFYTPVVFSDGTVKTNCPSAALVSNLFMEKYNSRHAYDIVAGPNYSRIIYNGLVGPDYNFSRDDLDILEPMGVNAIVYVPRQGTYINSNQTAKQNPVTALSKVNVRELVIFIQDEIEKILGDYQWEFNNATLRSRIKEKADSVLENIKANGGVNAYINVCDESNNTNDVIDNEMLVISTSIEPGKGAGKMVQELTLYKSGGLSSIVNA